MMVASLRVSIRPGGSSPHASWHQSRIAAPSAESHSTTCGVAGQIGMTAGVGLADRGGRLLGPRRLHQGHAAAAEAGPAEAGAEDAIGLDEDLVQVDQRGAAALVVADRALARGGHQRPEAGQVPAPPGGDALADAVDLGEVVRGASGRGAFQQDVRGWRTPRRRRCPGRPRPHAGRRPRAGSAPPPRIRPPGGCNRSRPAPDAGPRRRAGSGTAAWRPGRGSTRAGSRRSR